MDLCRDKVVITCEMTFPSYSAPVSSCIPVWAHSYNCRAELLSFLLTYVSCLILCFCIEYTVSLHYSLALVYIPWAPVIDGKRQEVLGSNITPNIEPADRSSRYNLLCCQRHYPDLVAQLHYTLFLNFERNKLMSLL